MRKKKTQRETENGRKREMLFERVRGKDEREREREMREREIERETRERER